MELDGETRPVRVGDAVVIPPGAWHQIHADAGGIRFLCCCAPPYRHDDTYFD
jgi:mannose-6-phosphate isomerase-like protein (cupin superfamily)